MRRMPTNKEIKKLNDVTNVVEINENGQTVIREIYENTLEFRGTDRSKIEMFSYSDETWLDLVSNGKLFRIDNQQTSIYLQAQADEFKFNINGALFHMLNYRSSNGVSIGNAESTYLLKFDYAGKLLWYNSSNDGEFFSLNPSAHSAKVTPINDSYINLTAEDEGSYVGIEIKNRVGDVYTLQTGDDGYIELVRGELGSNTLVFRSENDNLIFNPYDKVNGYDFTTSPAGNADLECRKYGSTNPNLQACDSIVANVTLTAELGTATSGQITLTQASGESVAGLEFTGVLLKEHTLVGACYMYGTGANTFVLYYQNATGQDLPAGSYRANLTKLKAN